METTPEARPIAPGPLGILQLFLNSGHFGAEASRGEELMSAIRHRADAGDHQATIAKDLGLNRKFVAAISRGTPAVDEFVTPEAASAWLAAQGLLGAGESIGEGERARLVAFRDLLREVAADNTHGRFDEGRLRALDSFAASAPLVVSLASPADAELRPRGGDAVIGRLLGILYDASRDGSWRRLKRCPGMGCPFTFYDSSRNRTATWCSMSVCGNRAKVRSYQERRRSARAEA